VELTGEKSVVQGLVINRFGSHGVSVRPSGGPSGRNFVVGNLIGTDVTGTVALPNGGDGVHLFESPDNTVAGNVIAANRGDGVHVVGPLGLATGNEIAGNIIGTDASGSASLGNESAGVFVATGIARTNVNGNAIGSNGELGIDREDDSLVPVLAAASSDGARTRVRGAVAGGALTDFTLDFFASRACDPSGFGEGERYLGSAVATTDGAGNVSFDATVPGAGAVVTAAATDRAGTTSEFSRCVATTVAPPVVAFSAFRPKVDVDFGPGPGDDGFAIKATFRLDAASNGIDPLIEEVSLRVGSFAVTLPPGSFPARQEGAVHVPGNGRRRLPGDGDPAPSRSLRAQGRGDRRHAEWRAEPARDRARYQRRRRTDGREDEGSLRIGPSASGGPRVSYCLPGNPRYVTVA
jgi:Right handed beta helix region